MRSITTDELGRSLSDVVHSLEGENESVLIRNKGEFGIAVAALLVGDEFERLGGWPAGQAGKSIDTLREAFSDVPQEEIESMVEEAVHEVRHERYAARKAS